MKVLSIIECAYRATIEEQDDTVVWLTLAMRGAGGEFGVLLRGNAVNTAVRGQDTSGLAFGDRTQRHDTDLAEDITRLIGKPNSVLSPRNGFVILLQRKRRRDNLA